MTGASISGRWTGRYSYESGGASVPFDVVFEDEAEGLTGEITEPNTIAAGLGDTLRANLRGRHRDGEVTFIKTYQGFNQGDDPAYHGRVNEKATRIDGVWWFPAQPDWRGSFMLVREVQRAATGVRQKVEQRDLVDEGVERRPHHVIA